MHFETVIGRLSDLPQRLPAGDSVIDPILIGGVGDLPAWTRSKPTSARRAAALVLLFPDAAGEARLVLTERPDGLRHARQVSFPGGKEDPGDDFPDGTAIREAIEEVSLDIVQSGMRVVGRLDVVDVRVSGFMLTPVLAIAERTPTLVASPREVASILLPPVDLFLPGASVTTMEQQREGYLIRYGGYPYQGRHIWGATALALAQLGAILARERS